MSIRPKKKPKWYEFRLWLAKGLIEVARWVKPTSPEVYAFYAEMVSDMMIYGQHIQRVNPADAFFNEPPNNLGDGPHGPKSGVNNDV